MWSSSTQEDRKLRREAATMEREPKRPVSIATQKLDYVR